MAKNYELPNLPSQIFYGENKKWHYYYRDGQGVNQHSDPFDTEKDALDELKTKIQHWDFEDEVHRRFFLLGMKYALMELNSAKDSMR